MSSANMKRLGYQCLSTRASHRSIRVRCEGNIGRAGYTCCSNINGKAGAAETRAPHADLEMAAQVRHPAECTGH